MDTRRLSRIARGLVRRYPQPWRERYEDEVLALFEDSPPGLRDVSELARGWLVEHVRAIIAADDRPRRTAAFLALMRPVFAVGFALTALSAGYFLRQARPAPPAVVDAAMWGFLVFVFVYLGIVAAFWRRGARQIQPGDSLVPALPAWAGFAGLPILFALIVLLEWGNWGDGVPNDRPLEWVRSLNRIYIPVTVAAYLSTGFLPGRRLLQAMGHLEAIEVHLRGAEQWVAGCHEMIALGVPSPLPEAEAQVEHWTRERDLVRAKVEQLGYRARFKRV